MNIELPDTSRWGEPDWGIKVLPQEGKGINLRDCLVGQAGEVSEQAPSNQGLAQRGLLWIPTPPISASPSIAKSRYGRTTSPTWSSRPNRGSGTPQPISPGTSCGSLATWNRRSARSRPS